MGLKCLHVNHLGVCGADFREHFLGAGGGHSVHFYFPSMPLLIFFLHHAAPPPQMINGRSLITELPMNPTIHYVHRTPFK